MIDKQKIIDDINQYCSPSSLLIINSEGKLIRLYCSFNVMVLKDFHVFTEGEIKQVDAVKISNDLIMMYVIHRVAYPYYLFIIIYKE